MLGVFLGPFRMAYVGKVRVKILDSCINYTCLRSSFLSLVRNHGSAGIIVIGEEILKGHVADTNSHFIATHLFHLGIKVKKISVIGDNEEEIAQEVKSFSENFSYVITTGGIGPTHDDVTYPAIAKAFGEELKPHPELVKICADYFNTTDLNSPAMKLAHVPESAKLTYGFDKVRGRKTLYPNVSVHNVYIFPGIPSLMERLFVAVYKDLFKEGQEKQYTMDLYLSCTEVDFANSLNVVVTKYPKVIFGSYPKFFNRFFKVQINIQSSIKKEVEEAYKDLVALLPKEYIVNFDSSPAEDSYRKILNYIEMNKKECVKRSLEIVNQFCTVYRPSEICIVFHGDAESVVVTHLVHACLRKTSDKLNLNAVTFVEESSPPELEQFIEETKKRYEMKLERFTGSVDKCLKDFIDSENSKHYKAVFIGCVVGSKPNVKQLLLSAVSDHSELQWVNPLNEWTTIDICDFINFLYLPYNTSAC